MKKFIAKYLLYIYLNFIIDEFEDFYKDWAKPIAKIIIFIRSVLMWILSILLFPMFLIGMVIDNSDIKKRIIELEKELYK